MKKAKTNPEQEKNSRGNTHFLENQTSNPFLEGLSNAQNNPFLPPSQGVNPLQAKSSNPFQTSNLTSNPFQTTTSNPFAPIQAKSENAPIQMRKPDASQTVPIQIPNVRELTLLERAVWEGIKAGVGVIFPIASVLLSAPDMARATGTTIGIGIAGGGALGAGGGIGAGIYFDPSGNIGFYGSGSLRNGFLAGASATYQLTIVRGGIDVFGGTCYAIGGGGGELLVGGMSVLFNTDLDFIGVSGSIGIGAGIPFEFYVEAQHTWTTDPVARTTP